MPVSKDRALELINEKIKQFQHILDTATYNTIRNAEYIEAYHGTVALLIELYSEKEAQKFDLKVSSLLVYDYERKLKDYKEHISKCISQLKVYKERIQNFWEEPETTEHLPDCTINQKADVLLVTATKVESKAIIDVLHDITNQTPKMVSLVIG